MHHLTETCPLLPPIERIGQSSINFDWFNTDPRPILPDMKKLPFWKDPRRFYHSWQVLEKSLGVRRNSTNPFNFYVCVATDIPQRKGWGDVVDEDILTKDGVREMVDRYRDAELKEWERVSELMVKWFDPIFKLPKHGYIRDEESYLQLQKDATTVVGMRIFEGEAFGRVDENNVRDVYERVKVRLNISEPPGLAVFDI